MNVDFRESGAVSFGLIFIRQINRLKGAINKLHGLSMLCPWYGKSETRVMREMHGLSFLSVRRNACCLVFLFLGIVAVSGCDAGGSLEDEGQEVSPKRTDQDATCTVVKDFTPERSQFSYSSPLVTSVTEIVQAEMEAGGSVPDGHLLTGASASVTERSGGVDIQTLHLQHREVHGDGELGPRERTIVAARTEKNCDVDPDIDAPFPQAPDGRVLVGVGMHLENSSRVQSIRLLHRSISRRDGNWRQGAVERSIFGMREARRDFDDVLVQAPGDALLTGLALRATDTGGFNARTKIKHIGLEYANLNPDF